MPSKVFHPEDSWTQRHRRVRPVLLLAALALFAALQIVWPAAVLPLAIGLLLVGIPHGAVERRADAAAGRPGAAYSLLYLAVGLVTLAAWVIAPWPVLAVALALSAWHFRGGIGLFVIGGSLLWQPRLTWAQFEAVTGEPLAVPAAVLVAVGAIAWLALAWGARQNGDIARRLALAALFAFAHPVAAVASYFAVDHSAGETARLRDQLTGPRPWRQIWRTYRVAGLPALLGAAGVAASVAAGWLALPWAAGLTVAFIVPHMLPLERGLAAPDSADSARKRRSA